MTQSWLVIPALFMAAGFIAFAAAVKHADNLPNTRPSPAL
jgi:hypothetical protein